MTEKIIAVCQLEDGFEVYFYDVALPPGYFIQSNGKVGNILGEVEGLYDYVLADIARQRNEEVGDGADYSPDDITLHAGFMYTDQIPFDWRG